MGRIPTKYLGALTVGFAAGRSLTAVAATCADRKVRLSTVAAACFAPVSSLRSRRFAGRLSGSPV
jgi:hypothetical protein